MRGRVLKELLATETTYFTQVKTLDYAFVQPLKKKDSKVFHHLLS